MKENREVILMLELKNLIFTENFFYPEWEVFQLMLPNCPPGNKEYQFDSDDEDINIKKKTSNNGPESTKYI